MARQTLAKWHARWEADGEDGLQDRSSRPYRSPNQTDPQVEDLIEWLRRGMKLGPVMLVAELAEFGDQLGGVDDPPGVAAPRDLSAAGPGRHR